MKTPLFARLLIETAPLPPLSQSPKKTLIFTRDILIPSPASPTSMTSEIGKLVRNKIYDILIKSEILVKKEQKKGVRVCLHRICALSLHVSPTASARRPRSCYCTLGLFRHAAVGAVNTAWRGRSGDWRHWDECRRCHDVDDSGWRARKR